MTRPSVRWLATLIAIIGVAACADSPSAANRLVVGGRGPVRVGFEPVFSKAARLAAARLPDFNLDFDHVRVVIVRPPTDTVADTTITFRPGQTDVTLDLTVTTATVGEPFNAAIYYTSITKGVVFHGQGTVEAHAADEAVTPQQIAVEYIGPGATVARIALDPHTTSVFSPNPVNFVLTAFDANNNPVSAVPVSWSVSDPTVGTVSNTGTLTPLGKRGTVTVTALTVTGATDNASVAVLLPPTSIVLVSGGNQSGKAGSALGASAVVRLMAADGVGVAGRPVTFTAPAGGKVGTASTTTDASGLASTSMTLGGAAGAQSFGASAAGFSVSIPATAVAGDIAVVAALSGGGQVDTIGRALKSPLIAKVGDAFGNPIANTTVVWTRSVGNGTLGSPSSVTSSDGLASMTYTLGTTAGSETIVASVAGVPVTATFGVQAVSAPPVAIAAVSGNNQAGRVAQALANPFVVKVTDAAGNPSSGATVTWTATNGTIAKTTTTDAQGLSSNTMTIGTVTGTASAVASIANGKTAAFTATVQAGVVAKMAFRTNASNGFVGLVLKPAIQVELQDAAGNLTGASNTVTIALGVAPNGGKLTGTVTRSAVGGVATFDDLVIDTTGVGFTLVISSAGVLSLTTAPFTIAPLPPSVTTVAPAAIDAVFVTVRVQLTGTKFVAGATTVGVTGGSITAANVGVQTGTILNADFNITGGAATGTVNVSVTTPAGTSAGFPVGLFSTGTAPLQLGASHGGPGGGPYSLDCPVGAVATALTVRGGNSVDSLGVTCQTVAGAARTFGAPTLTAGVGLPNGNPAVTLACPANFVLTGLTGFIGTGGTGLNDQIAGICSPLGGGATFTTGSVGSIQANAISYTETCPVGLAVIGIQGGAGNLVDRTQIKCG